MRKITEEICKAFRNGEKKTIGNSHTDGVRLFLFGNCIAKKEEVSIWINNQGYTTQTTKERLNGLLEMLGHPRIYQKNWEWYWGDDQSFPNNEWVLVSVNGID